MDATVETIQETKTNALEVDNVSHSFGTTQVLDNVSLCVPRGCFTVLLGPNGAGKSTLFALITRLYDNVSGEIRLLGMDVRRRPSLALSRLGVVFQSRTLDLDLSLAQNLAYHASLHGIPRAQAKTRAKFALSRVELEKRAHDKVRNLSGGQTRRVEIARSMMHEPNLLLLDEPTVGLDVAAREGVISLVRKLVRDKGLGVLWATHLIDEIEPTDNVVVLHKGKVLFSGTVPQLQEKTGETDLADAFRSMTGLSQLEME